MTCGRDGRKTNGEEQRVLLGRGMEGLGACGRRAGEGQGRNETRRRVMEGALVPVACSLESRCRSIISPTKPLTYTHFTAICSPVPPALPPSPLVAPIPFLSLGVFTKTVPIKEKKPSCSEAHFSSTFLLPPPRAAALNTQHR